MPEQNSQWYQFWRGKYPKLNSLEDAIYRKRNGGGTQEHQINNTQRLLKRWAAKVKR